MTITRKSFYRFYWRIQRVIVPGLRNSQYAYKDTLKSYVSQDSKWLDLGCGHQILPEYMASWQEEEKALVGQSRIVVGIDCDSPSLQKHRSLKHRAVGDIQSLPFVASSFSLVTANAVLEHVKDPEAMLADVYRILAPNGLFILHTPNFLNYLCFLAFLIPSALKRKLIKFLEGRDEDDIFPTFYRINSPGEIAALAKKAGFQVIELELVNSSAETVMLGPLVIIELLIIRFLELESMRKFRSNIIAVLQKVNSSTQGELRNT